MTNEERKAEAGRIAKELSAIGGEELADYWVWEMTPMPVGLPSDEQLEEGRKLVERARKQREETKR